MAKWYFMCQTFVVLFLNFRISACLGLSNYEYQINDAYQNLDDSLVFEFLHDSVRHSVQKRDTNSTVFNSTTGYAYNTEKPVPLPPKKVSVPLQRELNNSTVSILHKNLGENGTGIRKDYQTTKAPPLIHNPEVTTTNVINKNTSTTVNTSIKTNETNHHDDDNDDLSINNISDIDTVDGAKKFNESLTEHNVTNFQTDANSFYNTSISNDPNIERFYWVNMTNRSDVKVNELLSTTHRRAATVKLSFDFPFYGHLIKNVTIATGGFLYTGDFVHSWLAATQYVAPLMANFDPGLSDKSFIKYFDNGTAFTVEWEKVILQDKPNDGEFTFQVTLFKNGDIVFVYDTVPLHVDQIQELHHPVKVGLSDAYIMDQVVLMVRRKTIYEYDRVNFNKTYIKNLTTILLKARPTCLEAHDCDTCLSRKLECYWCPAMGKCSQGFDRHRQAWLANNCDKSSFGNLSLCSAVSYHTEDVSDYSVVNHNVNEDSLPLSGKIVNPSDAGFSGILAILFLVGMLSGLSIWVFYAYRNPHTTSGQILIRYRPSQWRWRRGEARYTAATIHM